MTGERDSTRRDFLGVAAGAVLGSSGLDRAWNPGGRLTHRPRTRHFSDPLHQIEHVVILIQENCSFDRYFGTLRGVRGFADPRPQTLPSGRPVFYQPYLLAPLYLLPWRLESSISNPCDLIVDNGWAPMHTALDGGQMDGWLKGEHELPWTMSYYTRAELPWHMALADAFTVADGYFCSVLGPTNPNRLYTMSATIDPAGRHGGPVTDNNNHPPYTWTTYPERLQKHGISWRVYQQADNFDDNALAWFKRYQDAQPGSPLYENGMRRRDADAFARDVAAGRLPQVSWIIAPTAQSEHPLEGGPGRGADFCNGMLQALLAHPKVWAKTVFILTYDEPGGYFDHVLPPLPGGGTRDEFVGGEPIGLGFRVPTVVCSPWSRGGYVCSDTFDHTSLIRLLERRFGVHEPNISAWRRRTCGDLTACLDMRHADLSIPRLPSTAPLAAASVHECQDNLPGVPLLLLQKAPGQEPGSRPRRP
jgi:phospholipase C